MARKNDTATDIALIKKSIDDHGQSDDSRFKGLKDDSQEIKGDIKVIKENHLAHIQKYMEEMNLAVAKTTTNVDWIMRTYWIIAGSSIGALVTALINLLKHTTPLN